MQRDVTNSPFRRPPPAGNPCAGDNTIAALVAGAIDATAVHRLHAHLDTCPSCRQLVADLSRGLDALEPAALPAPGDRIGRYVVRRLIGVGGMGVVYEAHDAALDRRVALKLVRPDLAESGGLLAEARAMAKLSHPNVAAVFDVGRLGDQPYICMEYVGGGTLREWLAAAPRRPRAIVEAFMAAGRGLAYVHRQRLVHLDFKPDNVLVEPSGRVVVSDFGLAALVGRRAIAGTPAYMAPEQRRGDVADARADQYAFCVALAEGLGDDMPRWARRAIDRGRHRDRDRRFASMDELLARLAVGMQRPRRRVVGVLVAAAVASIASVATRGPEPVRMADAASTSRIVDHWLQRDVVALPASNDVPSTASNNAIATELQPDRALPAQSPMRTLARAELLLAASGGDTAAPGATPMLRGSAESHACDDGSELACTSSAPECPAGSAPAIQAGCWTCADRESCRARGIPHTCDDGSPLRCAVSPPSCPGATTASVRGGCWSCADPFACTATSSLRPELAAWTVATSGAHGVGGTTIGTTSGAASQANASTGNGSNEGRSGSGGSGDEGSGTGSGFGEAVCGNGFCEDGEDHASCPADCCPLVNDGSGMTCQPICGNGFCEDGEDHTSCPADCCALTSGGGCA